ncbi:MAG: hypothetical protein WBL85_02570 [Sedimentisphaerales bacterium]
MPLMEYQTFNFRPASIEIIKKANSIITAYQANGYDLTLRQLYYRFVARALRRIALNMEQVQQYKPPPNFAKLTDTRCSDYIAGYGRESWELDALDPKVIWELIGCEVNRLTDRTNRQQLIDLQESDKQKLAYLSDHWEEIGI